MATATTSDGAATRPVKGFKVLCPECQNPEGTVRIDLNNLAESSCSECDWEGSPREAAAKLAEQVRRWEAVARWAEAAGGFLAD